MKKFTITNGKGQKITSIRAHSAQEVAKWLRGRLVHSCPCWGLVRFDQAHTLDFGEVVHITTEVNLHW
jgi:hypothetical protein